jgi:DNA-binding CsgD family transcriptional regulator/PAS domain-containing protein
MAMHQMDIQRALSISLAATDTLIEGLNLCLEASLQISGMDCGGIYLFDTRFQNLNMIVHKRLSEDFVKDVSTYDKDAENVLLIQKGEPLYILKQNLRVPLSPAEQREGLRALASLPLFDKSKVSGCINVASHVFDEISTSSRIALETIAAQAGNVIARLQAKQALQESEEHLSSLMLNAEHYAVYRLTYNESDAHGLRVVFVSPSIMDIMGVANPNKFETWFENIHADDRERVVAANLQAFETKEFNEVMKINHPQKIEHRWIHSIAKGITSQDGDIQYVNGIIIDITERKLAEEALLAKEKELASKTNKLEEINIALNVLLEKREQDKILLQEQVLSNVKKLAIPYVEKLKKNSLTETQRALLDVIESSLHEIISPFSLKLSSHSFGLTPTEIKVADLVRQGKGTKEVATIRNLSHKTVARHRENIRNKLGIKNKKVNLQSHLNSLA